MFAAAFNAGTPEIVYEDGAVFVRPDGVSVTGADVHRANAELLALGLPITVRPRRVEVADDIALLIVDWTIEGDGVHLEGTATDVACRGEDGHWRYVIDNPFGVRAAPNR
ncbi:YybH family protein [Prauserella flavalba]|uniref:YybH family protein n=1 Tax=Prauserella flavalba TaxID=1477506 RepID=UPI001FE6A261|nr:nuclear transport factor 2 family protein [Prauserella flavalba]